MFLYLGLQNDCSKLLWRIKMKKIDLFNTDTCSSGPGISCEFESLVLIIKITPCLFQTFWLVEKKSSSNQSPRNLTQQNSENKFLKNEPTLARPVFVFLFFPNTKTGLYLTKLENMLLFESKSLKLETSYTTVIVAFPFGECFLLWVNGYKYLKFLLKLLLNLFVFLNWPNPASFCLFSFFLHDKYSTNTINEKA